MTSTRRAQIGLVVALLVLIALAFVGLARDREQPASPFTPLDDAAMTFATAATETPVEVGIAHVCAPEGGRVTVRSITPAGGSGTVAVAGFDPTVVTADCASEEPLTLVAALRRTGGESATVDGFVIAYDVDGERRTAAITRATTLCRQLAEC